MHSYRVTKCTAPIANSRTCVLCCCWVQVLKTPTVLLFPFFSVGVNLAFISLLDRYQTDAFLNPLFQ